MDNIIDLARHDSLNPIGKLSTISSSKTNQNSVFFSSDCNDFSAKYLWTINNSSLEVYSYNLKCNNRLISTFDFGQIFNDPSIAISHVTRLTDRFEIRSKFRHPYKLIVILSLSNRRSYICIVDVRLNSVLNTIDFPFTITSAEVILSGTPVNQEKWPLVNELICMNGILAIGCDSGLVFFIDLILDSFSPIPLIPKQISIFNCNSAHMDLKNKRRAAIFNNQVMCIPLNTDAKNKNKFNYRSKDTVLATFPTDQVYVSALHFVPQLALICVGYNFGGFHLYNLSTFSMECCCSIEQDLLPIISFAYQSPENDPKNYSYLWIVRGFCTRTPNLDEVTHKACSSASMYLLCYENKELIEEYGILYNTFKLCCCKFEFPLTANCYDKKSQFHSSSKLLDIFTIPQTSPLKFNDEEVSPIDYNLLFMAWQAQTENDKLNYFIALFDLNQWYKTQMPKCFCVDEGGLCPFISIYSFTSLAKPMHNSIQGIYLQNNSLSKFSSNLFYSDIHSYPGSLSFRLTVASKTQICNASYFGFQKQQLNQFATIGPSLLVDPESTLNKCFQYGLIPPEYMFAASSQGDISFKRELLLNIALENGLTSFLIDTIKEWAMGEMINLECDLKHILDWTWKKVTVIKNSIDSLIKPLFDFSGCNISQHEFSKLLSHENDLTSLSILLKQLPLHATILNKQGLEQLMARSEIVQLIRNYLKTILLFNDFNLLPEHDSYTTQMSENVFCYPHDNISRFYSKRREDFITPELMPSQNKDVLLIDILLRHLGPQLSTLWKREDESGQFTCLYPPPNMHSLLNIFLIESLPLIYKESVLIYFLLDICQHCVDQQPYMEHKIDSLISSLSFNQGTRLLIQGLWYLDNQKNVSALQCLTHPMVIASLPDFKVNVTLFNDIMQRIVEMFMFASDFKSALIFSQSSGQFLTDNEHNEQLYIQLLVLNGNLAGAIEFLRQRRYGSSACHKKLQALFCVCQNTKILDNICRFPLDEFEENAFVEYLLSSSEPSVKRFLILYFILNNKLLEAISLVKQFEQELDFEQEENKRIIELIDASSSKLPDCLTTLNDEITHLLTKNADFSSNNDIIWGKPDDETTIKINPKQRGIKNISSSNSIEKVLEMKESTSKRNSKSVHSVRSDLNDSKRSLYLSPLRSRQSKIIKAKNQSATKDLFLILKTPEVKRHTELGSQMESFSDSPRKPSILKHYSHDDSASDRTSESHKLKVSFSLSKNPKSIFRGRSKSNRSINTVPTIEFSNETHSIVPSPNHIPQSDAADINETMSTVQSSEPKNIHLEENEVMDTNLDSTPGRTRPKVPDTPTHRMKLRSKKP